MSGFILAPSILSADFGALRSQIMECAKGGAKYLHFDVMDGSFVPPISFGVPVLESIRDVPGMEMDVHLMVQDPLRQLDLFLDAGADILTFHAEALRWHEEISRCADIIRKRGKRVGLALKPETDLSLFEAHVGEIDQLLVMTVRPGFGGQRFMPETLPKIKEAREIARKANIELDIEVDGGISSETLPLVKEAGANVFVAGSAVFKGDILGNCERLRDAL